MSDPISIRELRLRMEALRLEQPFRIPVGDVACLVEAVELAHKVVEEANREGVVWDEDGIPDFATEDLAESVVALTAALSRFSFGDLR